MFFLLFLEENNMLTNSDGTTIISNEALASLALFVAASKAELLTDHLIPCELYLPDELNPMLVNEIFHLSPLSSNRF